MQFDNYSEATIDLTTPDQLAEVVPLPRVEVVSYYQRNSGALPHLDAGSTVRYTRAALPSPVDPHADTVVRRFMNFLRVHRPSRPRQR